MAKTEESRQIQEKHKNILPLAYQNPVQVAHKLKQSALPLEGQSASPEKAGRDTRNTTDSSNSCNKKTSQTIALSSAEQIKPVNIAGYKKPPSVTRSFQFQNEAKQITDQC